MAVSARSVGWWTWRLLVMGAVALVLAACAGEADDPGVAGQADEAGAGEVDEADADEAAGTDAGGDGVGLEVADGEPGTHLVDGEGVTVYLFTPDEGGGESTCTGGCAETWPPVPAPAEAGDGVDEALVGTTTREDGSAQLTYDGWPLYYFNGDEQPGDVAGQGINDVWFVVGPDGEQIEGEMGGDTDSDPADY